MSMGAVHTISNLDLYGCISFRDILYATNDLRHGDGIARLKLSRVDSRCFGPLGCVRCYSFA